MIQHSTLYAQGFYVFFFCITRQAIITFQRLMFKYIYSCFIHTIIFARDNKGPHKYKISNRFGMYLYIMNYKSCTVSFATLNMLVLWICWSCIYVMSVYTGKKNIINLPKYCKWGHRHNQSSWFDLRIPWSLCDNPFPNQSHWLIVAWWLYSEMELGQHWLRYWLGAWWHQAITWTSVDFAIERFNQLLWHSSLSKFTSVGLS